MNINKQERDKLRELAEKATPGPWEATRQTNDDCYHVGYFIEAACGKAISDDGTAPDDEDAQFIAAANPATILALLDMIDRPAPSGDVRERFEKRFGPNDGFAWRDDDGKYKSAALQSAWEVWQAATEAAKATGTAAPDTDIFDLIREWAALPEGKRHDAARAIIGRMNRSYSAGVADGKVLGEAARQPAPVAIKTWQERIREAEAQNDDAVASSFNMALAEIADLRAALESKG